MGLSRVLMMYKPVHTVNLVRAKLRVDTGIFDNQFKFNVKKGESDLWFATDNEKARDEWVEKLKVQLTVLNHFFAPKEN